MKLCRKCNKNKNLKEFPRSTKGDRHGLNSWCRSCHREYARARRKTPGGIATRKKWMESIGGNKGFYQKYKQSITKAQEKYRQKPSSKELHAIAMQKRRALEGDREVFTKEQWLLVKKYYSPNGICLSCGKKRNQTIEHVKPISRGGKNDIRNIQPLCQKCNSSKYTKEIDFREDGGNFANMVFLYSEAT